MIKVRSPRNIVLENIAVGHNDQADHDVGIDIDQTGDGKGSRMTYDGVWVYGCYQRDPFRRGLCLSNLGALDTVVIQEMQGNIRLSECGGALILANNTCEGAVVVDGSKGPRDGFLGFQFRLATLVTHPLYLRDSNSIVMSDLYVEQADSGLFFAGRDGDPPGRATIQGAKLNTGGHPVESANFRAFDIDNYHGKIFFGHDQFYIEPNPLPFHQTGSNPVDLYVYACTFYDTLPALDITPAARVAFMSNLPFGMRKASYDAADVDAKRTCADLPAALDDLRRLGWADLHLNFP